MEKEEIKKEVLNFLNNHRKAIVAIVGGDGKPTTSLMLYVIDDDLNVFFGTRKSFGKYSALNNNPNVSLTVIQEKLDPLQAVDVRGRVEFVPEEDTEKTLSFFESKNTSEYYVKGADDFVMFKVVPSYIRWLDATSGELVMEHLEM